MFPQAIRIDRYASRPLASRCTDACSLCRRAGAVVVKQEEEDPETARKQFAHLLEHSLSEDVLNGGGFLSFPSTFSTQFPPSTDHAHLTPLSAQTSFSNLSSAVSPQVPREDTPRGDSMILAGLTLFDQIDSGQFCPANYYIHKLSATERKRILLENQCIQSLLQRSSPVSLNYFSKSPYINDGCYFLVRSSWLQAWRSWLQHDDADFGGGNQAEVAYQAVQKMLGPMHCPHDSLLVPPYIHHFIVGQTTLPCTVPVFWNS